MENNTPDEPIQPDQKPPYIETPEDVRKNRKQWLRGPDSDEEAMDEVEEWLRELRRRVDGSR